jgi:hypothetical protein
LLDFDALAYFPIIEDNSGNINRKSEKYFIFPEVHGFPRTFPSFSRPQWTRHILAGQLVQLKLPDFGSPHIGERD